MRWKTRVSKTRSCFAFILSGLTRTTECETSNFLYHITPKSNIKVTREKRKRSSSKSSYWLFNKFSLRAPKGIYREQYGEYTCWSKVQFCIWVIESDAVWGRHSPCKLRVQRLNKKAAACLRVTIMNMFNQCVNNTASKQPITWLKWPLFVPEKDSIPAWTSFIVIDLH